MWTRLTPDQAVDLYRVAPLVAADTASEFYESSFQPRSRPGFDGPWSLLRVRHHVGAPGVLTWQIANIEPEQVDWATFDPLARASAYLLLNRARLEALIDLMRRYADDLPTDTVTGPPFVSLSDADLGALGLTNRRYADHRQSFHAQAFDPLGEGHRTLVELSSVAPHPAYFFYLGLEGLPGASITGPAHLNLDRAGHETLADALAAELPTLE